MWYQDLLICPKCDCNLELGDNVISCTCNEFGGMKNDFRLNSEKFLNLSFLRKQLSDPAQLLQHIDTTHPKLTFVGPTAIRDSRELMSEVSLRLPSGGRALDLGCGPRDQAKPLEFLGFLYVGVDYANNAADLLVDAHSLPFQDASFDCVFSYAVLEHLHNPFVALHEVARVLKPGGWFIGTVSQGEPFHSSYFHHTPWALISLVDTVPGLKVVRLWDSSDTLSSLASMGRYSRVIKGILKAVNLVSDHFVWLTPRKMRWSDKEKQLDRLYRAGSVCFSIQKAHSDSIQL